MRRAVSFGVPREEAILAATLTPAREIGADARIGSLEPGKLADFVVCDAQLKVLAVYLGGEKITEETP